MVGLSSGTLPIRSSNPSVAPFPEIFLEKLGYTHMCALVLRVSRALEARESLNLFFACVCECEVCELCVSKLTRFVLLLTIGEHANWHYTPPNQCGPNSSLKQNAK